MYQETFAHLIEAAGFAIRFRDAENIHNLCDGREKINYVLEIEIIFEINKNKEIRKGQIHQKQSNL